jgi:hypothetical protein
MSQIITSNLNEEFNKMKKVGTTNATINRNPAGVTMGRSAIIDKSSLSTKTQKKMRKMANAQGVDVKMTSGSFYHPLFQTTNMMLPRDRRERNEWCRHFYRTEPIVATALDMHTEYPISDFNHVCSDPAIKDFFDYMSFDRLDIINLLLDIGLEYWKVGDVFPFGQLNETEGMWDKFTILNPDYIDVKSSVFAGEPIISLLPDEQIRAIVESGPKGSYGDIYRQLPDDVIRSVKMGKNIHLDNRLVSHISHKASQYETWGTPILMRCFKTLIYKDKLRQAQDAIASRHITPLRVAKIGAPGEPMPSQDDIDSFRDTLLDADQDPNYFLVYHYALQFDYVGSSGKILPLNTEFDFIQKEIMNGLCINQALLNGEGPTYANAQVGMDALARRYMSYRLRLENWIKHKVYKPIAEIQGFYKPIPSEINGGYRMANRKDRQLIIPDIRWDQQDLTSNQSVMNFVQQLQGKGLVSMSTVLPMLGLDPEIEKKNLETERGTVFDPNAPKTGPLPNTGELPSGGNGGGAKPPMPGGGPGKPGTTPPAGGGSPATPATPTPAQPPKPPTDNSPAPSTKETSLNVDDFFTKSGDSVEQVNPRKVTRVIHSNSQKPNKVGEN